MTPPQVHISFEELSNAGILAMRTVGDPGTHGASVIGMHGAGVGTPSAAAVSAITSGLAIELHIPNGIMFIIGLLSMILAAGVPLRTLLAGNTVNDDGATPKLHCSIAPIHTRLPIRLPFRRVRAKLRRCRLFSN